MVTLRSGRLPAINCLPSDWKRTMEGSAPAAMVRSMAALVRDAITMLRSCRLAMAARLSLLRSKPSGGAERRMRRAGRRESSGTSTSAAGSRYKTQSASPRGETRMSTAWLPARAVRPTASEAASISYTVPLCGASTKTAGRWGCRRTTAGAASRWICLRTRKLLRSTTATERPSWLATKQ